MTGHLDRRPGTLEKKLGGYGPGIGNDERDLARAAPSESTRSSSRASPVMPGETSTHETAIETSPSASANR
jgi:hypothetical protein